MAAVAIKKFSGMIPRVDPRLLKEDQAELALNCYLGSGALDGYNAPAKLFTNGLPFEMRRAYRFPNADGSDQVWLILPSEFSSVVRSPLANDTERRIYWTNPDDQMQHWSTWQMIKDGVSPYSIGTMHPSEAPSGKLTVTASGGTAPTSVPYVSRSYCYTFINSYGEESRPNLPSDTVQGAADGTWNIYGMPALPPANPVNFNYPPVTKVRLYRTVTGQSTGAQFFQVDEFSFPPPDPYTDTTSDTLIVAAQTLDTAEWGNPPDFLDGLVALPGGMLAGFRLNTVHFSEPNRPHAWPAAYDISVQYDIVGMGVWQQSLVVLTKGTPFVGSGTTPLNFTVQQVRAAEPCLSRGSIVVDLTGVYYSSQNGLVRLSGYGITPLAYKFMSEKQWLVDYKGGNLIACRHRETYMAINGTDSGFAIDFVPERAGVVNLDAFKGAVSLWNDDFNGDTYLVADNTIYRWDDYSHKILTWRWRSRILYSKDPLNFGAVLILLDRSVMDDLGDPPTMLCNDNPTLVLADGINAKFNVYRGQGSDTQRLVFSKILKKPLEIFRLPSGFKDYEWQCELISRVPVYGIEIASTMQEMGKI